MAKNDAIIIDGILDDRVAENIPSNKRDEAFEYFSIEQILKDRNLDKDEILSGIIDGKDDGGLDAFYIFINGHLLADPDNFFWPKANAELEVYLINCKHHDTFKQAPLDNIAATISEIFDFSIEKRDLAGSYNKALLSRRDMLKSAYRKIASRLTSFKINITYASRGDAKEVGESIFSRGEQIKKITEQSFNDSDVTIDYIGSTELVNLSRKLPNFSLELPFSEVLAKGERYVVLTKIADYKHFVTDSDGKLRNYLFESNIRDFMGLNRVNLDIKETLEATGSPDFWWLNNGVTILATSARVIGKTIHIEDIQIVNGLQTTESIYKYFNNGGLDTEERSVLVKIIVSTDDTVRDSIILATNNQTTVELTALHATDKIQKDIEDVLLRAGLYYERKTNFYQNQGVANSLIIPPLYLAGGFMNLILKEPYQAASFRSKALKNRMTYERVFPINISMDVWPQIGKIMKSTDKFLEEVRPIGHSSNDRFLKRYRYVLSLIATAVITKDINFNVNDLIKINLNHFTPKLLREIWEGVILDKGELTNKKTLPLDSTVIFLADAVGKYHLKGLEEFRGRNKSILKRTSVQLDRDAIERVFKALPKDSFSFATYQKIAEDLAIAKFKVYKIAKILKREGRVKYLEKDLFQVNS